MEQEMRLGVSSLLSRFEKLTMAHSQSVSSDIKEWNKSTIFFFIDVNSIF